MAYIVKAEAQTIGGSKWDWIELAKWWPNDGGCAMEEWVAQQWPLWPTGPQFRGLRGFSADLQHEDRP